MYKFINFPKLKPVEEYTNQTQNFFDDLNSLYINQNFSLYSIGELGLPGVSDLDFLIISDDLTHKEYILNIIKKYNLIDIPIFLEYSKIENLEYLTHHYNFNYIGGNRIDEKLFIKKNKNLFLIYSWKVLFFSGLRNFYIPYYKKEIDVKKMLSWINDLRYPIYYLSKMIKLDDDILNFINEYEIFRNTWFEHQNKEKLLEFLIKGINISWKLIEILSKNIKLNYKNNLELYGRVPTIFKNNDILDFKRETEFYFEKISKIDRFLVLHCSMYYKNWNLELKETFELILKLNKGFLKFGFDSKLLNIILFFKKMLDLIKISIYKFYEKN